MAHIESGRNQERPLLSVIIPVYNEAATIDAVIRRTLSAPYEKEVLIVDDGSNDGTSDLLIKWTSHPQLIVLFNEKNLGKTGAIRSGLARAARGKYTIIQDADFEYDPEDFPVVLEPLIHGMAQVVYGSRYLSERGIHPGQIPLFRLGVAILNRCVRILYGVRLTDHSTCYKVMSTELFRRLDLECNRFEFCSEVTAKLCRMGIPIVEVPISYHPRSRSEGKKIRVVRDGFATLKSLWKWRKWRPGDSPLKRGESPIAISPLKTRIGA